MIRLRYFILLASALSACPTTDGTGTDKGAATKKARGKEATGKERVGSVDEPAPARPGNVVPPTQSTPAFEGRSLPASDRVFTIREPNRAAELVLGTRGSSLWAARPTANGFQSAWQTDGVGAVQAVTSGELGGRHVLFVGRGRGRGTPLSFVLVDRIDPVDGTSAELWRASSERSDIAHMLTHDVDADGKSELVVAWFESKHRVAVAHIEADGTVRPRESQLMATSRLFYDADGDGVFDEAVGRIYSDDRGSPGDLTVRVGERTISVSTERGVRTIAAARLADDDRPTLYFADGWASNYGKDARALLARARWQGNGFSVQRLAESPDEMTFFAIHVVSTADGYDRILVQGSGHLSALERSRDGDFELRTLASFERGVGQGAVGGDGRGGWSWYWPAEDGTRVTAIDLGPRP